MKDDLGSETGCLSYLLRCGPDDLLGRIDKGRTTGHGGGCARWFHATSLLLRLAGDLEE
jgi:hypothetical protein